MIAFVLLSPTGPRRRGEGVPGRQTAAGAKTLCRLPERWAAEEVQFR
jgi:hypothetical protein